MSIGLCLADGPFDPAAGPRLGLLVSGDPRGLPNAETAGGDAAAPLARIEVDWSAVERIEGVYDWTEAVRAVEGLTRAGYRPVVALGGTNPLYLPDGGGPSPLVAASMDGWTRFLRGAVSSFGDAVSIFEIALAVPAAAEGVDADVLALVLKQSALAVRAQAGERPVFLAQPAVRAEELPAQARLWERDVAAYVDVLPVEVRADAPVERVAEEVRTWLRERLAHPPAQAVWVRIVEGAGWPAADAAVAALGAGASVAFFAPDGEGTEADAARWAVGLQAALGSGFAPADAGRARLEYPGGAPAGARVLGRFFRDGDLATMIVYSAPAGDGPENTPRLVVDARSARNVRVLDPLEGRTRRVRQEQADDGVALLVDAAPYPGATLYERPAASPGLELESQELEVASDHALTAEEIIARYQVVQREQDDHLERWTARGLIEFHFSLAQGGGSVDVAVDSNYFWERGGELEWEQTRYWVNGNKVTWKNIPELPLIQPEKIVTLPLDLTLDRTYAYRLVGTERVAGRPAWVLEFQPAEGTEQRLYRGRVWIDAETFARVQARLIQSDLDPPVISNEEVDRFAVQTGPDGRDYWMFSDIDGQQIWNVAGRSFVVRREVTFREFAINPPRQEFERERERAYASQNRMLRDTEEGFRYLTREDDGSRVVQQEMDTSQLFAAAGAFQDHAQDNVVPLAGVNYFNYDAFGRGIQFNGLFAGVLGFANLSKPDVFGGRMDLTADLGVSAIRGDDKVFDGEIELVEERVERRSQSLAVRCGFPAGPFFKLNLIAGGSYRQYFDDDDARNARAAFNADPDPAGTVLAFVLPQDHLELSAAVELVFHRRGWGLSGEHTWFDRSEWSVWGLRDGTTAQFGELAGGVFVAGPAPAVEERFRRWGVTASKEWYLARFQKLRGAVDLLGGSDLDRFSRYQFSFFGNDRLNGFSGSGVRFDEGAIARAGYSFNVFEVLRLDLALETARVEEDLSPAGRQSFTGIGVSGNVVGPWRTVINLNYGRALGSDIPELEGQDEFLLLVFKLF
jgi:hypothetical protein